MPNVTSQNIKALVDSVVIPVDEKEKQISNWMIFEPGHFWPAITRRMLGKKRLLNLMQISLVMMKSENSRIYLPGEYLYKVLTTQQESEVNYARGNR